MACFAVIILSGFISISAAKEACDHYAAVGQSLTLRLDFKGLKNTHGLSWYHNAKILFDRQGGKVIVGKPGDVSATGDLQLKNLQFSSAGIYHADYGISKEDWSLCVMDKVSKPQLTYVCDFKSSTVNLNCDVSKPQGLDFSWMPDDTSSTRQTLSVSFKEQRSFTCSVGNNVSSARSDTVRPTCTHPSPSPPNLLCFPSKTVVAAVAGGVSLILLLIVIVIVLCFYYRCNKTQKGLREKGAVRMLSVNMREPDISPDYETMNPTENPPPPSPKPPPRVCNQNVPPPEAQTGNGLLQLSTVAERQPPSPVPKPRTKTTNIGMCLPQETFSDKEKICGLNTYN
ncbi:T-cell surface antigen CD2 [Hippoglossus hippoglossus]|uniref:T-cell surface antigen CD2 n=1 Tax=Hippoglossus hippoglossus TaxID=8267 RepID=UPI00148BFE56|nr:T-cell surface antigen CD2 [Hippoglossus hippoglossus]